MAGFVAALREAGLLAEVIPTYRRPGLMDKWLPALRALRSVPRAVRRLRAEGKVPIVYAHAGAAVSLARESVVLAAARRAGAVTVLQLHAVSVDRYLAHPIMRRLLAVAVAPAHALAVLTPYWRDGLIRHGFRQPIFVVPDPLPPDFESVARAASPRRAPEDVVRVCIITHLRAGKGVDLLVRAAQHLPPKFSVVVAGDGPERAAYERLAKDLALSNLRFVGWVEGQAKHRLLADSDVFCLPTRYDSFGMGFIEAMCYALPVVALRWGPVPSVVADGESAVLVDQAEPEPIALALQSLQDPVRRAAMGAAGRRVALERYGLAAVARCLSDALRQLAQECP